MQLNELAEKDGYSNLLAGILRQTIEDYILSKRMLLNNKTPRHYNLYSRISSCERFFADPPYDYGDIDFRSLQRLCDEKVIEGGRLNFRDYRSFK